MCLWCCSACAQEVSELNYLGKERDECAYDCTGDINISGSYSTGGPEFGSGDVIGTLVDRTEGFIEFYTNGALACRVDYDYEGDLFPALFWQCRGTVSLV